MIHGGGNRGGRVDSVHRKLVSIQTARFSKVINFFGRNISNITGISNTRNGIDYFQKKDYQIAIKQFLITTTKILAFASIYFSIDACHAFRQRLEQARLERMETRRYILSIIGTFLGGIVAEQILHTVLHRYFLKASCKHPKLDHYLDKWGPYYPVSHFIDVLERKGGVIEGITSHLVAPFMEELVYRHLIQEITLKKIPAIILEGRAPPYSYIVDTTAMKTLRIVLTGMYFGYSHHHYREDWRTLFMTSVSGMGFGILQELSGHPFYSACWHAFDNYFLSD